MAIVKVCPNHLLFLLVISLEYLGYLRSVIKQEHRSRSKYFGLHLQPRIVGLAIVVLRIR